MTKIKWGCAVMSTLREDGHEECVDVQLGFASKADAQAWGHALAANCELEAPWCAYTVDVREAK